jgi:glucokinase
MSEAGAQAIGIDVGGTKTAALRVASDGSILAREAVSTPAEDMSATLDAMVAVARATFTGEVATVGVCAAGLVERDTGIVRFSPNLSWRDADLVSRLEGELGVPVVAEVPKSP